MNHFVSITVVTYNSGRFIKRCLESALEQNYSPMEVIVVDNASTDGTIDILEQFSERCRIHYNQQNTGFAGGQNQAIALSSGEWILTLNPDVLLEKDFIARLVQAGEADPRIGTVCGKLFSIPATFEFSDEQKLDSTGIFFTPTLRHFDRGSQEADTDRYQNREYVFGATAAAALYRRAMIDDISIQGEFFDADFFAYREDADVAWRAQLLGWRCLYTPLARGYHVRTVLPDNRRALPAAINMHSVKNRFLMRIKNVTANLYWRNLLSITARDLLILIACLVREQSSLKAFWFVARNWKRTVSKRREIMSRRRVDGKYIAEWFRFQPVSYPAPAARTSESVRSTPEIL